MRTARSSPKPAKYCIAIGVLTTLVTMTGAIGETARTVDTEHDHVSRLARAMMAATISITVDGRSEEMRTGGGAIFNGAGIVVTNAHVVDGATSVSARLSDGTEVGGRVVRLDPRTNLAVVQLSGRKEGWTSLPLGNSDRLRVGEGVYMVAMAGSSGELRRGHITELFPLSGDVRLIQTNLPVRLEDTGNPLFDSEGRIIGVVTAALSGGRNMASATAVNIAKDLLVTGTTPVAH